MRLIQDDLPEPLRRARRRRRVWLAAFAAFTCACLLALLLVGLQFARVNAAPDWDALAIELAPRATWRVDLDPVPEGLAAGALPGAGRLELAARALHQPVLVHHLAGGEWIAVGALKRPNRVFREALERELRAALEDWPGDDAPAWSIDARFAVVASSETLRARALATAQDLPAAPARPAEGPVIAFEGPLEALPESARAALAEALAEGPIDGPVRLEGRTPALDRAVLALPGEEERELPIPFLEPRP
jgi:hypothetical protein